MAKRINDTELRKRQILEKASELFLEKGYAGVGIDEIAETCGVVRGTILRYFHSKKELYNEVIFGRGNMTGSALEQYCNDESVPALTATKTILLILEKQLRENILYYKDKLRDTEFKQNFDVFRLPIFRNEAMYIEQLLVRGNQEGVFCIENPKLRANSFIFAIFGLAEADHLEAEAICEEMWTIAEKMLEVKIREVSD